MQNLISQALAKLTYCGNISSATTTNGIAVDRTGHDDLLVVLSTGAVTGTGVTIDVKIQMDDNSGFSSPTDITGAAFTQLDQDDDSVVRVGRVNLRGAQQYIRAVIVTAGTSPVVPINVACILGMGTRSNSDGVGYTSAEHDFNVDSF